MSMESLVPQAAAATTVRLHEFSRDYLSVRKSAAEYITLLQQQNERLQLAIHALMVDEQRLRGDLQKTSEIPALMRRVDKTKVDETIPKHQQALVCENPVHLRLLQLKAAVSAEEDVMELLLKVQGEDRFSSVDDYLRYVIESGRRIFHAKFLMHRLSRELMIPIEDMSAPSPVPSTGIVALTSASTSSNNSPGILTAVAQAPPVPKRLPPKAALKISFPQASDKMIEKALLSSKNDMAAARKKLKQMCGN